MHRRPNSFALVGGVITAAVLAACRAPSPPQTPPVEINGTADETDQGISRSAVTETPALFKPELVICTPSEPDRLVASETRAAQVIREALLPSAVSYGGDYAAEPVLLEALPNVEDGTLVRNDDGTLTVVLRYRDGLTWSDGTPFTAADALLGLEIPARPTDPVFQIMSAIQVDDQTLEVKVQHGAEYPYVPPQPPLPAHILGDVNLSNPDMVEYFKQVSPSLGAYSLAEWTPGSHMLLQANPEAAHAARIPSVRVRYIPDGNQIIAEVSAGGCDVALDGDLTLEQMPALTAAQGSGQVRVYMSPGTVYEQLTFNTRPDSSAQVAYFADARVRRAVAQAIDRGTLIELEMLDLSPVMDSWLPSDHWAYAGAGVLTQYNYDLTAAGALLDAAGWSDQDGDGIREYHGSGGTYDCQRGEWAIEEGTPLTPTLVTSDLPARIQLAEQLRNGLRQIGIDIQVQTMSASTLFAADGPLTRRSFDLALFSAAVRPDPGGVNTWLGANVYLHPVDLAPVHRWELEERWIQSEQLVEILGLSNIPGPANDYHGQNLSGWCHEAADFTIVNATRALNIEERRAAYAEHQRLWAEELPSLPLFARPRLAASRTYMCGITLGPYDVLTWNLAAWSFDETGACGE